MANGVKYGGRKAGTPNRVSSDVRKAFQELVEGEIPNLRHRLSLLSDRDYFTVLLKMAEFFIPKYQSITVNTDEQVDNLLSRLVVLRDQVVD